jgi:hypothetical protein
MKTNEITLHAINRVFIGRHATDGNNLKGSKLYDWRKGDWKTVALYRMFHFGFIIN